MAQVRCLLKPGGLMMLDTPNGCSLMRSLANLSYKATLGGFKYPVQKLYHRFHLFYYTPKAMKTLIQKTEYERIVIDFGRIPIVKARGTSLEKFLVRIFSHLERFTGKPFEIFVLARKPNGTAPQQAGVT